MRGLGLRSAGASVLFMVGVIVFLSAIATSFDFARGIITRMQLYNAMDAAARAAAEQGLSEAEREIRAHSVFDHKYRTVAGRWHVHPRIDVTERSISLSAGLTIATAFMGLAGIHEIAIAESVTVPIRNSPSPRNSAREF